MDYIAPPGTYSLDLQMYDVDASNEALCHTQADAMENIALTYLLVGTD